MIRRDGADVLWLVLLERGTMHHEVDCSELEITDGDLILLDAARASRSRWSAHRQLFASFPREVIEPFSAPALISGRLPANHACGRLLAAHLRGLWAEGQRAEADVRSAMGQGLTGLTRASFSSASLVQSHGDQDASGQALLAFTIRRWMFSQLHRQDLDAATVAAQFHLSRSSLYRLFEPWGGVRCVLQEQRLRLAVERLPQHQGSMVVLANDLGFASASAFSHAFRSRWGVPPREWQHRSTGRDQRANSNPKADGRRDGPSPRQHELDTLCSTYYHQLNG